MVSTQELIRAAKRLNDAEDAVVDAHAAVIEAAKKWLHASENDQESKNELALLVGQLEDAEAKLRDTEK